jgi:transposase
MTIQKKRNREEYRTLYHRHSKPVDDVMLKRIAAARNAGLSCREIGSRFGISKDRVLPLIADGKERGIIA